MRNNPDVNTAQVVRLFHRTARENAEKILKTGRFQSKDSLKLVWFSNRVGSEHDPLGSYDKTSGYGDYVVAIEVPLEYFDDVDDDEIGDDPTFQLNDEFPDGEKHFTVTTSAMNTLVREGVIDVGIGPPDAFLPLVHNGNVIDFSKRSKAIKDKRTKERSDRNLARMESALEVIASDPGMQREAARRVAERKMAERSAGGADRFKPGDRVRYVGHDETYRKFKVGGKVVEQVWHDDYNYTDAEGKPTSPSNPEAVLFVQPVRNWIVDWQDQRGETHQGIHTDDELEITTKRGGRF